MNNKTNTHPEYDAVMNTYNELQGMSKDHKKAADAILNSGNYEPTQLQSMLEPLKSAPKSQLEEIINKFGKKSSSAGGSHNAGSHVNSNTGPFGFPILSRPYASAALLLMGLLAYIL